MKLYTVTIGGIDHLVQLSDEDAKAQGLGATGETVEVEAADLRAPSAKGETVDEHGRPLVESAEAENEARKARKAVANKARSAETE